MNYAELDTQRGWRPKGFHQKNAKANGFKFVSEAYIKLYGSGLSTRQIGLKMNVSFHTVNIILNFYGVKMRKKAGYSFGKRQQRQLDRISELGYKNQYEAYNDLYSQTQNAKEIGKILGLSSTTILTHLRRYNILGDQFDYEAMDENRTWRSGSIDVVKQYGFNYRSEAFITFHKQGLTQKEIAIKLCVSPTTVHEILKFYGVLRPECSRLDIRLLKKLGFKTEKECITYLYNEHKSSHKVSDITGLSSHIILTRLNEYGVKRHIGRYYKKKPVVGKKIPIKKERITKTENGKYLGVSWNRYAKKWQASIEKNGNNVFLFLHEDKDKVAKCYNYHACKIKDPLDYVNVIGEEGHLVRILVHQIRQENKQWNTMNLSAMDKT